MSLGNLFKNFAIDSWYKSLIYIGGIITIASLFFETKAMTNQRALLLGLSILLIGLGEWKNHKIFSQFKPPNVYTGPAGIIKYPIRMPDIIGISLDFLGMLLALILLFQVVFQSGQGVGN